MYGSFEKDSTLGTKSHFSGSYKIPRDLAGGEYTVTCSPNPKYAFKEQILPSSRKVRIRSFSNARLLLDLEFTQKGYGAGDNVTAILKVKRTEGGALPIGAKVSSYVRVDGRETHRKEYQVNGFGMCEISFTLPSTISKSEATLSVVVDDNGAIESKVKTIPLILEDKKMKMEFATESTDDVIINTLANKIYFSARSASLEPLDITGEVRVLENNGSLGDVIVEDVETLHEGRGFFIIPANKVPLHSKLVFVTTSASGVKPVPIPLKTASSGLLITEVSPTYQRNQDIAVTVLCSPNNLNVTLKLFLRQTEISSVNRRIHTHNSARIAFPKSNTLARNINGVLRVAAYICFDSCELASERLIFREVEEDKNNSTSTQLVIHTDKESYTPGSTVVLTVSVLNKKTKKPVVAMLGISASDLSVAEMIDKRLRPPTLLPAVYLENEVYEFTDPEAYFEQDKCKLKDIYGQNEKKVVTEEMAIDLLLGMQSWRRFLTTGGSQRCKKCKLPQDEQKITRVTRTLPPVKMSKLRERRSERFWRELFLINLTSGPYRTLHVDDYSAQSSNYEQYRMDEDFILHKKQKETKVKEEEEEVEEDAIVFDAFESEPTDPNNNVYTEDYYDDSSDGNVLTNFIDGCSKLWMSETKAEHEDRIEELIQFEIQNWWEYNHYYYTQSYKSVEQLIRKDFKETVLWIPVVIIDSSYSSAALTLNFSLSQSITSFKILVDGLILERNTLKNNRLDLLQIASSQKTILSKIPFYVETVLPTYIQSTDQILLPITVVNDEPEYQDVIMKTTVSKGLQIMADSQVQIIRQLFLEPNQRKRQYEHISLIPDYAFSSQGNTIEEVKIASSTVSGFSDVVSRSVSVFRAGFPDTTAVTGLLLPKPTNLSEVVEDSSSALYSKEFNFTIPPLDFKNYINNTLSITLHLGTSSFQSIETALDRFIHEPIGCFEQTSSTTYPLVMILQYYKSFGSSDSNRIYSIQKHLTSGTQRLLSFETPSGGFDWYGKSPASEALTAMGISQFVQIEKIMPQLLSANNVTNRSLTWLMSRKTKDGFYHSRGGNWGGEDQVKNAYIMYSLTETFGGKIITDYHLEGQIERLKQDAESASCSYLKALIGNVLMNIYDESYFNTLNTTGGGAAKNYNSSYELDLIYHIANHLKNKQVEGEVRGGKLTITYSDGISKSVETTSLAVLLWSKLNKQQYEQQVFSGLQYLFSVSKEGYWYSTQATVLALKAIISCEYFEARTRSIINSSNNLRYTGKTFAVLKVNNDAIQLVSQQVKNSSRDYYHSSSSSDNYHNSSHKITFDTKPIQDLILSNHQDINVSLVYHGEASRVISYFSMNFNTHKMTSHSAKCKVSLTTKLENEVIQQGETTGLIVTVNNVVKDERAWMPIARIGIPGGFQVLVEKLEQLKNEEAIEYYEVKDREVVLYWESLNSGREVKLVLELIGRVAGNYTGQASSAYEYYFSEEKVHIDPISVKILPALNK